MFIVILFGSWGLEESLGVWGPGVFYRVEEFRVPRDPKSRDSHLHKDNSPSAEVGILFVNF